MELVKYPGDLNAPAPEHKITAFALMITNLIKQNGRVVGAMGFPMEEDKAIVICARAIVISTGCGTFVRRLWRSPAGTARRSRRGQRKGEGGRTGAGDCHERRVHVLDRTAVGHLQGRLPDVLEHLPGHGEL